GIPGGKTPSGGRIAIIAAMTAGLGGIRGGKGPNGHGETIAGMPGRGGGIVGLMRRGPPIGKGGLPNFPDLYAAVV
ncbi:unnamed protein product, partial [Rotaria socialis]